MIDNSLSQIIYENEKGRSNIQLVILLMVSFGIPPR